MFDMKVSGLTDVGIARNNNEDSYLIDNSLFIVADGMGGAAAGEVASQLAVKVISSELKNISYTTDEEAIQKVTDSIKKTDSEIKALMKTDSALEGMGTTLVMGICFDSRILISYIGDSRAYIISKPNVGSQKDSNETPVSDAGAATGVLPKFDNGKKIIDSGESIVRITQDHSVVMEMVNSGVITEEDIRTHPMRNRITRCLGSIGNSEPDFTWHTISDGDKLVLCSDGLWEMVHEDLMFAIINSSTDTDDMCKRLVTAANNSGGSDNITIIIAMFTEK